jgi:hypothetical protein
MYIPYKIDIWMLTIKSMNMARISVVKYERQSITVLRNEAKLFTQRHAINRLLVIRRSITFILKL